MIKAKKRMILVLILGLILILNFVLAQSNNDSPETYAPIVSMNDQTPTVTTDPSVDPKVDEINNEITITNDTPKEDEKIINTTITESDRHSEDINISSTSKESNDSSKRSIEIFNGNLSIDPVFVNVSYEDIGTVINDSLNKSITINESNESYEIDINPSTDYKDSSSGSNDTVIYDNRGNNNNKDSSENYSINTTNNNTFDNSTLINLKDLILESFQNSTEQNNSNCSNKITLSGIGRSITIPECYDGKINFSVIDLNENNKEVIVSSEMHINESIEVTLNIDPISKEDKDSIKVFNEDNESVDITFQGSNEPFYNKISWTIPHLSRMSYKVIYNPIISNTNNNSSEIIINTISPLNGSTIKNPLNFEFNITYQNNSVIECMLAIDDNLTNTSIKLNLSTKEMIWPYELANGNHLWFIQCKDLTYPLFPKEKMIQGNFVINDLFSLDFNSSFYYLNENVDLKFRSNYKTNISLTLTNPSKNKTDFFSLINNSVNYSFIISKYNFSEGGVYQLDAYFNGLEVPYLISKNISIAKIGFDIPSEINENDTIEINTNIISPKENINSVIIQYGDNEINDSFSDITLNTFNKKFFHTYKTPGNYIIRLKTKIFSRNESIQEKTLLVKAKPSQKDTEKPRIYLIGPKDNERINSTRISFTYKPSDNQKITNCTFELYNNSGILGILDYTRIDKSIENNKTIEIIMDNFYDGEYLWYVGCYDNSSNYDEERREFSVLLASENTESTATPIINNISIKPIQTITYDEKTQVDNLKSGIERFLAKQISDSPEEKEVLEELGISENLTYYLRRLNQIDQDLGNNLKFISDENERIKRKAEIRDEIKNIERTIPTKIEIIDKYEYVKNSMTSDIVPIIKDYLDSKSNTTNKYTLKTITDINAAFQKEITISTKVKQLRINYNESIKEITIITKEIKTKNETTEILLEYISKDISPTEDIKWITTSKKIKDSIYEIKTEDLIDNKLIYTIEKIVPTKEIEKTDTILYKKVIVNKMGITGYFMYDPDKIVNIFYIVLIIVFLIIIVFLVLQSIKRLKIKNWKKEEDVRRIFDLIKVAKKDTKKDDLGNAKQDYHKIKNIYPLIPKGCQRFLYKDIKEIRTSIDKKEIFTLVEEYERAKKESRTEDSKRLYENIRLTYKRLPKRYREIVYNKMFKSTIKE